MGADRQQRSDTSIWTECDHNGREEEEEEEEEGDEKKRFFFLELHIWTEGILTHRGGAFVHHGVI